MRTATLVAGCCAVAAARRWRPWAARLVGGLVQRDRQGVATDSALVLAPLGPLVGEADFGPVTRAVLSACEGAMFGFSLGWGLTFRPSLPRRD